MEKTVFRNPNSLRWLFIPEKVICRDDIIKKLIEIYLPIITPGPPFSKKCMLIGNNGLGKTTVALFFANMFKNVATEKNTKLSVEYYNSYGFNNYYKTIRDLSAKYVRVKGRRPGTRQAQKLILEHLIEDNSYLIVILNLLKLI